MGLVVAHCDRIREDLGCALLLVHLFGKDPTRGGRGTNALPAAVETEFALRKKGTPGNWVMTLSNTLQKDLEEAPGLHFDLVKYTVGPGRETLVPVVRTEAPSAETKLPPQQQTALTRLEDAIMAVGEMLPTDEAFPPGVLGVEVSVWAERFGETSDSKPDSKRRTFSRVRDALLAQGLVGVHGGWAWVPGRTAVRREEMEALCSG